MSDNQALDQLLIEQIRAGDAQAWNKIIERFEGRLLAFCESRLGRRAISEDVVQETFIGFLTSLPNFDHRRPIESYLFSICAHKLTDHLRREGRRPTLPLSQGRATSPVSIPIPAGGQGPSAILRSQERKELEDTSLAEAMRAQIDRCQQKGDWTKLMCIELLLVRGRANKDVAARLGLTEQQVANYKSDFLIQLRKGVKKQQLPADLFPELYGDR